MDNFNEMLFKKVVSERDALKKDVQRLKKKICKNMSEDCNTEYGCEEMCKLREDNDFLEMCLHDAFVCLIKANAQGKITDTLWVSNFITLWDMFCQCLNIDDIEKFEKEVLNDNIH